MQGRHIGCDAAVTLTEVKERASILAVHATEYNFPERPAEEMARKGVRNRKTTFLRQFARDRFLTPYPSRNNSVCPAWPWRKKDLEIAMKNQILADLKIGQRSHLLFFH